jgi:DNA-binding IclR family transcriptional regulator
LSPRLAATGAKPQGRLALLVKDELARNQKLARQDVPTTMAGVADVLEEVRRRGMARAVNTLLPGVAGFCAPVFDADGHLALGMVALGSLATFDAAWDGAVARPLAAAARQLSRDLGFEAA